MSATMEEIREALAESLRAIDGMQANAYPISNPTPPSANIIRGDIEYDAAMDGGTHELTLKTRVYVSDVNDIAASKNLDIYVAPTGDKSIKAAIEADTTLGGLISALHVTGATGEQVYKRASGVELLGSEWNINLWL